MRRDPGGLRYRSRLLCAGIAAFYFFTSSSINLFHTCADSRDADAGFAAGTLLQCVSDRSARLPARANDQDARLTSTGAHPSSNHHGPCPACLFNKTNQASNVVAMVRTHYASPVRLRALVIESVPRKDRRVHSAMPRAPPRARS
jgi:hypothetical protein